MLGVKEVAVITDIAIIHFSFFRGGTAAGGTARTF